MAWIEMVPLHREIGIPSDALDACYTRQRGAHWCWAASIASIFCHNDLCVSQEQIVELVLGRDQHGRLRDRPIPLANLAPALRSIRITNEFTSYGVRCEMGVGEPASVSKS